MLRAIQTGVSNNIAQRGSGIVYRENHANHCPGCGRSQWYVGRVSAECGFCATALPLSDNSVRVRDGHTRDNRPVFFRSGRGC